MKVYFLKSNDWKIHSNVCLIWNYIWTYIFTWKNLQNKTEWITKLNRNQVDNKLNKYS